MTSSWTATDYSTEYAGKISVTSALRANVALVPSYAGEAAKSVGRESCAVIPHYLTETCSFDLRNKDKVYLHSTTKSFPALTSTQETRSE